MKTIRMMLLPLLLAGYGQALCGIDERFVAPDEEMNVPYKNVGGLNVPVDVAGFNLNGVIDNEKNKPGMGYTIYYNSIGIKSSVYIYALNYKDLQIDTSSNEIIEHFKHLMEGIEKANIDAQLMVAGEELRISSIPVLHGVYTYIEPKAGVKESFISHLYLTVINGRFVKLRISYNPDEFVDGNKKQVEFVDGFFSEVAYKNNASAVIALQNDLFAQYEQWYTTMATENGRIPKSISGISSSGEQFIYILDGSEISQDHRELNKFNKAILEKEESIIFAYATLTLSYGSDLDEPSEPVEELEISVGDRYGYRIGMWSVQRHSDGSVELGNKREYVGGDPQEYPNTWFLTDVIELSQAERDGYIGMWADMRNDAMFRSLTDSKQ